VSEGYEGPKDVKDDRSIDGTVHIQFAKILDDRDSSLIVFEDIVLQRSMG
jgi:hypothetical protein